MTRDRWHIAQRGDVLVLSRLARARAGDPGIWAETCLPGELRPLVLAHEIRKDVWRALKGLRGFSPVVEVQPCREGPGLSVCAGGVVDRPPPAPLRARLEAVLADRASRRRWISHARRAR